MGSIRRSLVIALIGSLLQLVAPGMGEVGAAEKAVPRSAARSSARKKLKSSSLFRKAPSLLAPGGMDLHAHLLMKDGMSFLISGDVDEPPRSTQWKSRVTTKLTFENLEATGLNLIVVSLYAHPWVAYPKEESLKKQVSTLEEWVRKNPRWIIARNAAEARAALQAEKKVFVLSIEGAVDLFDTPEQRNFWLHEKKIRIVTPLHLTPDALGAPALMQKLGFLNAPGSWLLALLIQEKDASGVYVNPDGLSAQGREVISNLVNAGVWIDLAHASDRSQKEIYARMKVAGQPALYTHTILRKYHRAERGVSEEQLGWVKESGGMVGLLIAQDMDHVHSGTAPGHTCTEGFGALSAHWITSSLALGDEAVTIGSDFNAPLQGLEPRCLNADHLEAFKDRGFHRADQVPQLFKALGETPERLSAKVERFLSAWERVQPQLSP